jgi:prepilin-type N-terminal cleavage/methylation domain-containing protein
LDLLEMETMRFRAASRQLATSAFRKTRGVSLLELLVSVAIIVVISGMALPAITKTLKTYQLNDAANQLAGIVKFTRFEAIRRNTPIKCVNSQAGAYSPANIWSDNDGDGVEGPTEKQILLGPAATLVPAGIVPSTAALAAASNIPTLTAVSPGSDAVKFDQRGAVVASPPAVYVYFVGNTSESGGFRAVIVLPSGSVQVWTYAGGTGPLWQQIS